MLDFVSLIITLDNEIIVKGDSIDKTSNMASKVPILELYI